MLQLFGRLDPAQVQNALRKTITRLFHGEIGGIYRTPFFFYVYYRAQLIALQLFVERTAEIYPERMRPDGLPEIYDELMESLQEVHIYAAAVAWLEIGDWRWNHEARYVNTPDLHYGLVLSYPEPVLAATAYLANLYRTDLEKTLSTEGLVHAETTALKKARELDPKFKVS